MGINGQVIIGSTRTGPLNVRTCPVNVSQHCPYFAQLALPGGQFKWRLNTGILSISAAAAAAVEPAVAKQVQVALDSEVQVQVYWQVDPSPFEFERTVTNFEVEV